MDEIINEILSLLETQFSTTFKKYYYGQVQIPNQSSYPCIMVYPISTSVISRGNKRDDNAFQIGIAIEQSYKKKIKTGGGGTTLTALQELVQWMENRDANGDYEDATVINVIRKNFDFSGKIQFNDNIEIDYQSYMPAGEEPTVRAEMTLRAISVPDNPKVR